LATSLHILAAGRLAAGPEADLVERYRTRISWPVKVTEVREGRPFPVPPRDGSRPMVSLDERGTLASSADLAAWLGDWQRQGAAEIRFLIGGADGLPEMARSSADRMLALGRMTWPHLLARALLMEQLYRALTILSGHPYHRA
jgi:23S rRNA (pseudouridine1915-N3)-methyltransferase